jgi:hypothetical protein
VSDSIVRSSAETTPVESDWRSPNGLPIAATGSPTEIDSDSPSRSGVSDSPSGSTFSSATSAFGSWPTILAGTRLPSENSTKTCSAGSVESPRSVVTTCALVAM